MNLKALPLQSQYMLSFLLFAVNNKNKLPLNSNIYSASTRQKCNFRQPSSHLLLYQKGVCSTGIKVFDTLPQNIKNLIDNPKQFKSTLKNYLHAHSLYFMDKYFNGNRD